MFLFSESENCYPILCSKFVLTYECLVELLYYEFRRENIGQIKYLDHVDSQIKIKY